MPLHRVAIHNGVRLLLLPVTEQETDRVLLIGTLTAYPVGIVLGIIRTYHILGYVSVMHKLTP